MELGPDSVNLLRRQRMERNRLAEPVPQTWSKMSQVWGSGYYPEFEYMPDEYERKPNFENILRQLSVEQRNKISNHDWRYASQEHRCKHETMIHDPRNKELFPYLGGDKDAELNTAQPGWLRNPNALDPQPQSLSQDGPLLGAEVAFLTGKGKGLGDNSRSSRMMLQTIVQRLERRLIADWEGTTVAVMQTPEDLIQIAFHMASVDSERGVLAYMNVLSKDSDLLGPLGLRKVSQLWGMRRDVSADVGMDPPDSLDAFQEEENLENTWIFFLLMPKWVRMRPTDAYYTIYPRSQGSAFRMSTAGSSVLLSLGNSVVGAGVGGIVGSNSASSIGGSAGGSMSARGPPRDLGPIAGSPKSSTAPASARGFATDTRFDLALIEQAAHALPPIGAAAGGAGARRNP